ncbi:CDP-alcohol phosphatidyltransferase family protein [Streptomyces sp. LaPpAH-108]|uniref:CDP-alcohol phosphatidyltransferase family protein n=1 Tax=Streptomyces sp. LaPpAH-108 TaxID=1155714 RepID=UPI00037EFF36|nr:CDP-alcohol phosphatidyltransferase family protein [Streptomyces sp. LaPpAH-108]
MAKLSLRAVQKLTCKKRDAWWTVFLVDPLATRLLMVVARFRFITPNGVTWAALFVGLASAGFFYRGDTTSLVVGALLYHFSFVLDCVDGKLARLKGNGSVFGGWLDYVFDRIRVLCCALALMGGQYLRTDDPRFLLAALGVVFLDMLRYLDALQIYKMRQSMRTKLERTAAERAEAERAQRDAQGEGRLVFMEDLLRDNPATPVETLRAKAEAPVVDLHEQFRDQFPWYTRVRRAMLRTRIRPHLFSGIEFQMFVFIVGPLLGRILWTTAASAALLLAFELFIMYKFWLSTRDFNRVVRDMAAVPDATAPAPAPAPAWTEPAEPGPSWTAPETPLAAGVPSQPQHGAEDHFPSREERLGFPHHEQYPQYDPYGQQHQPQHQQYEPYQRYEHHEPYQDPASYEPYQQPAAAHDSWFEPYSEPDSDPYAQPYPPHPSPQYPEYQTQPHAQPQPWTDGGYAR